MTAGSVALDIQGIQSVDHRDRGVARYVLELATALEAGFPDHMGRYLLNPDLGPPGRLEPLLASGKVAYTDAAGLAGLADGGIFHIGSPFELSVPLHRLWPAEAQRRHMRLVVTMFDLIPDVFAHFYLADPGLRRRYRSRQQLARAADHIVSLSQSTANDVSERLGVDPERITVIGGGTAPQFQPPPSRAEATAAARAAVPGLSEQFILYTAGMDDRKNLDRLLIAYSMLPVGLRDAWQLVIACRAGPGERNHYEHRAAELGIPGRLLLPGFVPDDVLVLLYQSTGLFVFPSLYEGYGLPVAEAMACGAPTLASATSSVGELVDPRAAFDPSDEAAISAALARGLGDDTFRSWLAEESRRAAPTWNEVAARTAAVYDRVLAGRPAPWRRRPLIAFATPLPPARTEVAHYSAELVDDLRSFCDVDLFADGIPDTPGDPEGPPGISVDPVSSIERVERCRGGYDAVVYTLGNSEFHIGSLAALRRRAGTVIAHDVRLTGLYALGVGYPDAVPGGFHACLHRMYGDAIPEAIGIGGRVDAADADHLGIVMAREIVALSEQFLATSSFAGRLAELDADRDHAGRIDVLPFAMRGPRGGPVVRRDSSGPPLVASFGVVHAVKQTPLIVEAFALVAAGRPEARLAVVGSASSEDEAILLDLAHRLGLGDRVTVTNQVSDRAYADWMSRATVAVQLRRSTNGEMSAAVGNCLVSGVPTVVTAIGAARDLPDSCVVKVAADITAADLAATVIGLLDDPQRRAALAAAAQAYAAEHTFARVAEALAARLFRPSPTPTPARSLAR